MPGNKDCAARLTQSRNGAGNTPRINMAAMQPAKVQRSGIDTGTAAAETDSAGQYMARMMLK